ncbi:hypothetical protein DICPUDRAFT_88644 [Dictyostelium purpureum]|uniref:Major facilitator superfamily (MFS) profile domain-containing protein n=1 Tax=Dictyostelium purpureum TaxID=5786 RepID=F0ZQN6_DICPU|nr:uncharacterized protein DICPUDRAFT_88644 [Dictyostelium purpureum]EGC33731.1 hypothetical protein DICPUDRAFT_88644 [Dictyostelium purpureum]|eukprot:XP_003289730.1 hypothetical protein DICPUDRAFT_88644 [Dictyostelium purpureum]
MESNKSDKTPMPWKKLIGAYVLLLCEAITTTSFFSYISPFIIFLGVTDKKEEVGFYGGYIASCFSLAQFLSSFFWGKMSDRFGRKPILIIGSVGSVISVLGVGISWSLPVLIASRSINGLLNGNIGVIKTYIGETTTKSNQIEAFGWIGLTWGLGAILGPTLGGLLADPVKNYPSVFGNSKLLIKHPYILPNILIAIITSIGCAFTYFFMNETLNVNKSKSISMSNLSSKTKFTALKGDDGDELKDQTDDSTGKRLDLATGRFEEDIDEREMARLNSSMSDRLHQSSSEYKIHQQEERESTTSVIMVDENNGMVDENESEVLKRNLLDNTNDGANDQLKNEDEEYDLAREKANFEDISLEEQNGKGFLKKSYTLFKNKLFKSASMANIKSSKSYQHLKAVNSDVDLIEKEITAKGKSGMLSCSTGDSNTNIFKNKLIMATTFLYCFVGFVFTMWDETFPIWAMSPIDKGGLGMESKAVGVCGAIGGVSVVLVQVFIIKPTTRKLGIITTFGVGNFLAIFSFFSFPLLSFAAPLQSKGTANFITFWVFVSIVLVVRNISAQFVFTPIMTLINNSAISTLRGSANGWGQSLVALTRTIAPTLASILLSWSLTNHLSFPLNHFFVFIIMSLCSILPFVVSKFLPSSLNAPIEEEETNCDDEMQIPMFE